MNGIQFTLVLLGLTGCSQSPGAGYFFAIEEIRQIACVCNESLDGRDPCELSIRDRTRDCISDFYDGASDSDQEAFECVDDVFTEYAECMDGLNGCDTQGASRCAEILESDRCPAISDTAGLQACGDVTSALE